MNNTFYTCFFAFFIFLLIFSNNIIGQFSITRSVFSNGAAVITSSQNVIKSTAGQSLINSSHSSTSNLWLGFWNVNQLLVSVKDGNLLPDKFELFQNYPNPFNPNTKIKYSVPKLSEVKLEVFNVLGQRVALLVNQEQMPGFYTVDFNASKLSSGFYIYRIYTKDFVEVKKMMLLK